MALKEQEAEKLARREERVLKLLDAAVEHYARATELFTAWLASRAKGAAEVEAVLKGKPEAQQLEYLRKQIEMRVLGCGWTQYATRWSSSSDVRIGTVTHLTALLLEIIAEEKSLTRLKQLPTEPAPPHHQMRDLGKLGTADADALALEQRSLFSADELHAKMEKEVQRRLEAGISDPVEDMCGDLPPAFDQQLVGKRIEVLWRYFDKDTKEPQLIWATGRVAKVADGKTDKRTQLCKKVLPAGAVLWAWDADPDFDEAAGEQWLLLLPKKWKKQQVYSWRWDPRELGAAQGTQAAPRPSNLARDMSRKGSGIA